ncbi:MAG TPA: hypothetical protein DD458_13120 [Prolixibacteraceae bacterium]|nr:hypothetical protein [Prolixibacteraceae bacterium]HCR91569.1 hypothetical protein [Prolixibacteraceae bacterium]HCU60947.1 hypothetical protein [Prolixibacteraceae bacterium]
MNISMDDKLEGSWRASWLISKIHETYPDQLEPWLDQIIDFLQKTTDSSKKREFLKLISYYPVPEEKTALMLDYCIRHFTSASEPVAVRVHAMQILFNISEREPELKHELIQLIEHEIEYHSSAGIKSRGSKLLRKLYRQQGTDYKSVNNRV